MTNPFGQQQASDNPFGVNTGAADLNEQELGVITKTNNPTEKTPDSFGLVDYPAELGKGVAAYVLSAPRWLGAQSKQAGELAAGFQDKTALGTFKESLLSRILIDSKDGSAPTLFENIGSVLAAEKDALVNLLSSPFPNFPERLTNAGNALIEDNKSTLQAMGLVPKDGGNFLFSAGQGFGSMAASVGITMISKKPELAAALMGMIIESEDYLEARAAKKQPLEAAQIAFASAIPQTMVEAIGGKFLLNAAANSTRFATVVKRTLGQGLEEGVQSIIEETVKAAADLRNTPISEKVNNVLTNFAIGIIVGAPVSALATALEKNAPREMNLTPEAIDKITQNALKNRDELTDELTFLVDKEASKVAADPNATSDSIAAVQEMIAEIPDVEKAKKEGKTEDPKIAARLIMQNKDVPTNIKMQLQEKLLNKEPFTLQDIEKIIQKESTDPEVMQGRVRKLDIDILALDKQIDQLLKTIGERQEAGKVNALNERRLDSLLSERSLLDIERAELLTATRPLEKRRRALNAQSKDITIKGGVLEKKAAKSVKLQSRALNAGLRKGAQIAREDIKQSQAFIVKLLDESGLSVSDKGIFISTIKNIQPPKQLQKEVQKIQSRIAVLIDTQKRQDIISKIKRATKKVSKSNVIAVDFAKQIKNLVGEIDTNKRSEATIKSLQSTLNYLKANPDAALPKKVLEQLEILNKRKLEDISTKDLQALYNEIVRLIKQGRVKLSLMEKQKERLRQNRISELSKNSVKLVDIDLKKATIGERLSLMDEIRNKYAALKNKTKRLGIATNPMDVFFDMLDGGQNYTGANYRIFKQTIDKGFSRYLTLKESVTRDVKNLADKLDLNEQNFEKIGAWAVLQQEGGEKKLLDSGITEAEIKALSLSPNETKMYNLMREKLDSMLPKIQEIMRVVYNQDVEAVSDYFPFLTDHEAISDLEIQDQLGPNLPSIGRKKNAEKGFTVSRTLGSQKIRIDAMGVFLKHVDSAAYLIEMGADIKALGDVAQSPRYKNAVGEIGQEMVVEWINLLARKGNLPGRVHVIDALRRNVGFAVLGFKLSSILIQPTSLLDGAGVVGGGYVSGGIMKVTNKRWRQFLWDNFPEIRERSGDDQAYLDMGGGGVVGSIREAGFWTLKHLDSLVASAVAIGAYTKVVEQKGGKVDLDRPDKDAIIQAQLLMRRSQSSAFAKDTPALLSQGSLTGNVSLDKLIFQFQSFMFNRWSLIKHDMWALGIKGGNTRQALNLATWLLLAGAAEIGIRRLSKELIAAMLDDELKPWEDTINKEVATTALGNVPFVSQVVGSLEYGSVPVPSIGLLTQVGERLKWAGQSKSDEKKAQHYTEAAILLTGASFGIPGAMQTEAIVRGALKDKNENKSSRNF